MQLAFRGDHVVTVAPGDALAKMAVPVFVLRDGALVQCHVVGVVFDNAIDEFLRYAIFLDGLLLCGIGDPGFESQMQPAVDDFQRLVELLHHAHVADARERHGLQRLVLFVAALVAVDEVLQFHLGGHMVADVVEMGNNPIDRVPHERHNFATVYELRVLFQIEMAHQPGMFFVQSVPQCQRIGFFVAVLPQDRRGFAVFFAVVADKAVFFCEFLPEADPGGLSDMKEQARLPVCGGHDPPDAGVPVLHYWLSCGWPGSAGI
ncbi:MAG: hypothetical protein U5K56_13780 [Halioglobus sp.]|nr:hypothetical protein [Halioglobus sp.]